MLVITSPLTYGAAMSPRNWIRAAVAVLGCVLIVQGTMEILEARDANAAPRTVGSTGADPTFVSLPAGSSPYSH